MHLCSDEIMAFMVASQALAWVVTWLRSMVHRLFTR